MEEDRLKQIERDWNTAIETNDVESMAKYMSDEWVIFSGDGQMACRSDNAGTSHELVSISLLQLWRQPGKLKKRAGSVTHFTKAATVRLARFVKN